MLGSIPGIVGPPLQLVDLLEVSAPVRGVAAFLLVGLAGVGIRWRYASLLDRAIDAALDGPLAALGYGIAAHLAIAFGGMYLGWVAAEAGLPAIVTGRLGLQVGLIASGSLGFAVVGASVAGVFGERHHWAGVGVAAVLAGASAAAGWMVGALVWVVLVSMGIGGVVRVWTHASFAPELQGSAGE